MSDRHFGFDPDPPESDRGELSDSGESPEARKSNDDREPENDESESPEPESSDLEDDEQEDPTQEKRERLMGLDVCRLSLDVRVSPEILGELLHHPALIRYPLSERRAILCHSIFLGFQLEDGEASLLQGLRSWEGGACTEWRREKMRRDCDVQLQKIKEHRYFLCIESRSDVPLEKAARDWIHKHAEDWRNWWEQQPESSPTVFPNSFYLD